MEIKDVIEEILYKSDDPRLKNERVWNDIVATLSALVEDWADWYWDESEFSDV